MREILFKAKRADNGEWVEGDYRRTMREVDDNMRWREVSLIHLEKEDYMTAHEVIPETVCQFTGLLDKNGKKIFEGDVVKYYQPYSKTYHTHTVKWDKLWACFGLFEEGNEWCKESDWVKIKEIEVIGNIHDGEEV